MDVNLGPGRTGRIGLHQGDDPTELAANFARTYQLDGEMQARLQKLIVKYMDGVVPELAVSGEAAAGPRSPGHTPVTDRPKKCEGRSPVDRSPIGRSPNGRSSGEALSPGAAASPAGPRVAGSGGGTRS